MYLQEETDDKLKGLRKLQALLIVHQYNFRILHWNVIGVDFDPVHELMSQYYSKLDEFIDSVVEISVMCGEDIISVMDAVATKSIFTISSKRKYESKEVFKISRALFEEILEGIDEAINDCEHDDVKDELKIIQFWIRKELSYKNARRMK